LCFQMNFRIDFFSFLCEMTLEFWWNCIESIDCFQDFSYFHNINSASPWTWEIFPSSSVLFSFCLQDLRVFIVKIFHLLS
jgi:hypothetical protein